MANMPDKIPPLPSLPIHGLTGRKVSQQVVDKLLLRFYEERPDLIRSFLLCTVDAENGVESSDYQSLVREIMQYMNKTFIPELGNPHPSVLTDFLWELRVRIRKMLNLPVTQEEVRGRIS